MTFNQLTEINPDFGMKPLPQQLDSLEEKFQNLEYLLRDPPTPEVYSLAGKQFEVLCIHIDQAQELLDESSETSDLLKMMKIVTLASMIQQRMGWFSDPISELTTMRDAFQKDIDPETATAYQTLLHETLIPELNLLFQNLLEEIGPDLALILKTASDLVQEILVLTGEESDYESRIENSTLAGLDLALSLPTAKTRISNSEEASASPLPPPSEPLLSASPILVSDDKATHQHSTRVTISNAQNFAKPMILFSFIFLLLGYVNYAHLL